MQTSTSDVDRAAARRPCARAAAAPRTTGASWSGRGRRAGTSRAPRRARPAASPRPAAPPRRAARPAAGSRSTHGHAVERERAGRDDRPRASGASENRTAVITSRRRLSATRTRAAGSSTSSRTIARTCASASAPRPPSPRGRRSTIGSCTIERDVARARHQPALPHHVPAADDGDRHDRQARLDRQQEAAALEPADAAVGAPRALGEHDERQALPTAAPSSAAGCRARPGCRRSTSRWPVRRRCQPRNGKRPSDSLAMMRSWHGSDQNSTGMS